MAATPNVGGTMELTDLIDIEAIKRVKYRYLRCIDQKLWDDLVDVLTEDCTAAYSGGKYSYDGRDAIIEFLRTSMGSQDFLSSHRCHHPEIDLTGADSATGVWALEDTVIMKEWDLTIRGAAFYTDTYRRTPAGWRIAHTGYKRTYEEIWPRAAIQGLRLSADFWATGGRSDLV